MRFLAIDFETNGLTSDSVLPCGAFPTQVSVTAYDPELDEITHLYDSYIHGAGSLSRWVLENTQVRLDLLYHAPPPELVSAELAALWQEGDLVVAHNTKFDLETVLPKITSPDHPLLWCRRVCTMKQRWCTGMDSPRLLHLCRELRVPYAINDAHSAVYDSLAVAKCVQVAHRKGLQLGVQRFVGKTGWLDPLRWTHLVPKA